MNGVPNLSANEKAFWLRPASNILIRFA